MLPIVLLVVGIISFTDLIYIISICFLFSKALNCSCIGLPSLSILASKIRMKLSQTRYTSLRPNSGEMFDFDLVDLHPVKCRFLTSCRPDMTVLCLYFIHKFLTRSTYFSC